MLSISKKILISIIFALMFIVVVFIGIIFIQNGKVVDETKKEIDDSELFSNISRGARNILVDNSNTFLSASVTNNALAEVIDYQDLVFHTTYNNLDPGERYSFAIVDDIEADDLFNEFNLSYLDQGTADENGQLSFDYIPRYFVTGYRCIFGPSAEGGKVLTWSVPEEGTLLAEGSALSDEYYDAGHEPWAGSANIKKLIVSDGVKEIGDNAFSGLGDLTEVELPDSLETISESAFAGNDPIKIIGHKNTIAESFAKSHNITFVDLDSSNVIRGDADGDGELTIFDATAIQRYLADMPNKAFVEEAADSDCDNNITIFDATAIQRYLVGLPSNEKIGKPIS